MKPKASRKVPQARRKTAKIETAPSGTPLSAWRKALFGVAGTAGFFVLLEILLAVGGVEPAFHTHDPFVGFASTLSLYVEEEDADGQLYMVTAPGKVAWFNKQRFLKEKAPGTYRIFTLGGSTTFGRPYDDKASFSGWLREFLNEADPSRKWEVINSGGVSYASYRVAKVMEELVSYAPDLFIIYSGHNEFLERRTYQGLIEAPDTVTAIGGWLSRTRIYTVGSRIVSLENSADRRAGLSVLKAEVDTILARSVGPLDYHRDDRFKEQVTAHYRFNLGRMVEMARSTGASVILVTPASNLKDCSPFKSEYSAALSDSEVEDFEVLVGRGLEAWKSGRWSKALSAFDQAGAIDDRYADLHYYRGLVLAELERWDEAKAAFQRAVDEDVCPLRILTSMREALAEIAKEKNVRLVDFAEIIEKRSGHGIPGADHFLDHVHLTVEGYRLLAIQLMAALERENTVKISESWNEESLQEVVQRVEGSLDRREHGMALRNLARVFAWAGKTEEAGRLSELAVEWLGEAAESYHLLGREALQRGDQAEAIRYLRQALEIFLDSADARATLGGEFLKKGEIGEAVRHFQDVLRLKPDSPRAHGNLGLALASLGEADNAIRHYREALRLDPAAAEIHSNLGVELTAQGKLDEAIGHFQEALRFKSEYVDAHSNLGMALSSQGKHDEAIRHFRRALDINPEAAEVHFNLAVALQKEQRLDNAVSEYKKALRLDPEHAGAHYPKNGSC